MFCLPVPTLLYLWEIYIFPGSVYLFCCREICGPIREYINLSQTHECGNWNWVRAIPRKGIHKWDFHCSVVALPADDAFCGEADRQLMLIYQLTNYAFQMRTRCTVIRFVSSSAKFGLCTLQRQNTEISKQIFPEKEYRRLSPNFHIHVSVRDLYIPIIGLPILLEEICRLILGLCKSLTDTWMWKLGLRPRCSQKRINKHKWDFRCSAPSRA